MPYRFSRSMAFSAPDCVELRYSLKNTGFKALPYLWTAHPQFVADENTRIVLPPDITKLVNVVENDPHWGQAGDLNSWPAAVAANGEARHLDRVRLLETPACRKFYTPPGQPISWAALVQEGLGCQLRLEWSNAMIPFLGLWVDEGLYNAMPVVALEPSNGYYDSLERAVRNQQVFILQPGETKEWTLALCFGRG